MEASSGRDPRLGRLPGGDRRRRRAAPRVASRSSGGDRGGIGSACRAPRNAVSRGFRSSLPRLIVSIGSSAPRSMLTTSASMPLSWIASARRQEISWSRCCIRLCMKSPAIRPPIRLRERRLPCFCGCTGNPGKPSLASVQDELAKLELIRGIELPSDCLTACFLMSSSAIGGGLQPRPLTSSAASGGDKAHLARGLRACARPDVDG